ncbi:MAG: thiamine ABC transporter substrate binding subunit [Beijerinckiaceae bacterium]|nr:thiamine ABC transporter substrate binding subunit [Beijerinckiaceae bacterium]
MLSRLVVSAALTLSLWAGSAVAQDKPTLTVYTYSSFVGKYGPGNAVKQAFEAECQCTLNYVAADDAGSLMARLKLEGTATKADVVLGLDANLAGEAAASGLFVPHGVDPKTLSLPIAWNDPVLVPFDWGYLAFIYDSTKLQNVPKSLKELVSNANGPKIVVQDPRTSAPGLGFLLWMTSVYGDGAADAWKQLRPRIITFTKGWSEAYGLFLKGEADMVVSYTTSPAYHIAIEKKNQYKAAPFSEGHYLTIELAGVTKTTQQKDLANRFIQFMLSDAFQAKMPEGNFMYPARTPKAGLPTSYADLIKPDKALLMPPADIMQRRRALIDAWLDATAR